MAGHRPHPLAWLRVDLDHGHLVVMAMARQWMA
jgi:hypothetical protein